MTKKYDELPESDKRTVVKAAAKVAHETDVANQTSGGHKLSHAEWHQLAETTRDQFAEDPAKIPNAVKHTKRGGFGPEV